MSLLKLKFRPQSQNERLFGSGSYRNWWSGGGVISDARPSSILAVTQNGRAENGHRFGPFVFVIRVSKRVAFEITSAVSK